MFVLSSSGGIFILIQRLVDLILEVFDHLLEGIFHVAGTPGLNESAGIVPGQQGQERIGGRCVGR